MKRVDEEISNSDSDSVSETSDEQTISSSSRSIVLTLSEISSSESSLDEFYYQLDFDKFCRKKQIIVKKVTHINEDGMEVKTDQ